MHPGRQAVRFTRERHGRGPEHLAAELGGTAFEVYPAAGGVPSAGVRLGFRVASVAEAVAAVQRLGGEVVKAAGRGPWGRRAVVTDPDGHRVDITEPATGSG